MNKNMFSLDRLVVRGIDESSCCGLLTIATIHLGNWLILLIGVKLARISKIWTYYPHR